MRLFAAVILMFAITTSSAAQSDGDDRPRARDLGIAPGILTPGPHNAITDVAGVRVGHVTLIEGEGIRTGVTAIVPHSGNVFQEKLPAGFVAANGFGKFMGSTQIQELGEIETPIVLTNTVSVPQAAEGVIRWTLEQPGNEDVRSVNAVIGETNDGFLNDIRGHHVRAGHAIQATENAADGPVAEGNVGAGTGTIAFGWKGGIGTSSRVLPESLGGYTLGVLVQANYGGVLQMDGLRVGEALGQYYLRSVLDRGDADGSIIVVVATDAPLSDRNLERLAHRSLLAIARTGSPMTNGSGDYAVAFSTAESVRRTPERRRELAMYEELPNDRISPLFQAAMEAAEEAIYNAILKADDMDGHRGSIRALPLDDLRRLLDRRQ